MNDTILVLIRSIRRDLAIIAEIYTHLERYPLQPDTDADTLISIAYHLHNRYNAFENIFYTIATTFEKALDDRSKWHAHLLDRMRLDLMPLRPAVIDTAAYDALDELRRFRHIFCHAYTSKLDARRLQLVHHNAFALQAIVHHPFEQFLAFLHHLSGTPSQ